MAAKSSTPRVLVVDDDDPFRERLVVALSDRGYTTKGLASFSESLEEIEKFQPTHAVVDLRLKSESGVNIVAELTKRYSSKAVMLTGYGSVATALSALREGAVNYLAKPCAIDDLLTALFGETLAPVSVKDSSPTLEQVEWEHIQRVLNDHQGNITKASKALGLHRRSLQRKLARAPTGSKS